MAARPLAAMRPALALLALVLAALPAAAQPLWQGAEYGMSEDSVAALFPEIIPPREPSRLGNGATQRLQSPGPEVNGVPLVARFYFLDDGLNQVTLGLHPDVELGFAELEGTYATLSEALTLRYGEPTGEDARDSSFMQSRRRTWQDGPTNVTMLLSGVRGSDALLNVVYQARISRLADDL